MGPDDHVEIHLVVGEVRLIATQVPGIAGGSQDRAGGRQGEGLSRRHDSHALKAVPEDRLPGEQGVVLVEPGRD